jgi:periplasmic divalent cation tolerance protein
VLLTERKAACVNIVSAVESHYWWKRKKETAQEHLLIVKTQAELLDELIVLVKKHHLYSIPEIIALPIIGGNEDYLRWVEEGRRDNSYLKIRKHYEAPPASLYRFHR